LPRNARHRPALLCCTPNLHNPTTATIPLERREAIAAIARDHDVVIVEDDAYGKLAGNGLAPLAALAPERTYHIASLSKSLAPALRVAYVACPDARSAARLTGAIRATTSMASPLGAAIATRWIETGLADQTLAAIRTEAEARRAIALRLLGSRMACKARQTPIMHGCRWPMVGTAAILPPACVRRALAWSPAMPLPWAPRQRRSASALPRQRARRWKAACATWPTLPPITRAGPGAGPFDRLG
jgi:hypothetical protein